MSYRFLPLAKRAYIDILWWYEIHADRETADMMRARFTATFQRIEAGMAFGSRRPEWLADPWRFSFDDPYWIIWRRRSPRVVEIGHILHARRDIAQLIKVLG